MANPTWQLAILVASFAIACGGKLPATAPVATCAVPRGEGSFHDRLVRSAGRLQLVATAAEDPWAELMFTAWRKRYPKLERVRPEQADKGANLILFGTIATNPLLAGFNGHAPIAIEPGAFVFGGRRYGDRQDGIAFIHPSPFAADRIAIAYLGNSAAGLALTLSMPTGGHDFVVASLPMGLATEGEFCRDGDRHRYFSGYASDEIGAWERQRERWLERRTAHHVLRFEPGSRAARDIERLMANTERDIARISQLLAVPMPSEPLTTYYWNDLKDKERLTGRPGYAHALGTVVHVTYGGGIDSTGPHEYAHAMAGALIGASPSALLREGVSVMSDGERNGTPLKLAAERLKKAGRVPPLARLLCCFRDFDEDVGYPLAGHLVDYVVARWGIDRFKQLYRASDPEPALQAILGVSVSELETAWRATF